MSDIDIRSLTPDEWEEFSERAAILQNDGGHSRLRAELEALEIIRRKRLNQIIPDEEFKKTQKIIHYEQKNDYDNVFDVYKNHIKRKLEETHINGFDPTEKGQAEAAEFYLDGLIRYTKGAGWLVYDFSQGLFRADIGDVVLDLVLQKMARGRYDLRNVGDEPKEFFRYAEKAVTNYGIKQVKELLKSPLHAADDDFDKAWYLLNCHGETYNLYDGSRGPSNSNHFHTRTTGFRPEEGDCPMFRKFMDEITLGDAELVSWIMRWFGYQLSGDTRIPYFVNFHGSGRNGKGTLLHVMRQIMGSYAREIDPEVIVEGKRPGNVKNALANLVGIRAGFAADVPAGALNLTSLKTITGGDEIVGERKYHDSFAFRPAVKLTFSSNPMLRLPETGPAIKSRLRYVPFRFSAAGKEDMGLEDRLLSEAPQILAWLIREAGECLRNLGPHAFPPCAVIDKATEEYIKTEDIIGQFLEERVVDAPYERVKAVTLYAEYKEWSASRGDRQAMSNTAFGRRLNERDVEKEHDRNGWWYVNIKIRGNYE